MNRATRLLLLLTPGLLAATAAPSPLREVWHDPARNRDMPVRVDFPAAGADRLPVVLMSHGLGGSREELAWIGRYWADHGYVAVHLQHAGSDAAVTAGAAPADRVRLLKAALTPEQYDARCRDVSFALDELARRNADPAWPLYGRLDLTRVGMAGHSYGAITTQLVCGQRARDGRSSVDPRLKCGIAFSPFPPGGDAGAAYADMPVPMFYWTGTEDRTPAAISTVTPLQHRIPFDRTRGADAYLAVLTGGDHNLYIRRPGAHPHDAAWLDAIGRGTTAFLDEYLKRQPASATYLDAGGFATTMAAVGTFEHKPPSAAATRP